MKTKTTFEGAPVRLLVRLTCAACGETADKELESSHCVYPALSISRLEERLFSILEHDGWFVYECKWFCPKHRLEVVSK